MKEKKKKKRNGRRRKRSCMVYNHTVNNYHRGKSEKSAKMAKNGQKWPKTSKKLYDFRAKTPYSTIIMKVICATRFFLHIKVLLLDPPLKVYY